MYGCGATECGQLPYLKFTAGAAGTEPAQPRDMDTDMETGELRQARNEVTVPTRLNLQFLQQQSGNKSAVVSSMVAGGYGTTTSMSLLSLPCSPRAARCLIIVLLHNLARWSS